MSFLHGRDGDVELVLQVRQAHLGRAAGEHVVQHHALVRFQRTAPGARLLQRVEGVIAMSEQQHLRFCLLDLEIALHRQVHQRRGDVARMDGVVDQRCRLRRASCLSAARTWARPRCRAWDRGPWSTRRRTSRRTPTAAAARSDCCAGTTSPGCSLLGCVSTPLLM